MAKREIPEKIVIRDVRTTGAVITAIVARY